MLPSLEPELPVESRIQPYEGNPRYWQFQGEPILLLGGSNQDNLFNHPHLPPDGLEAHLDLLSSVGGNYVRNTMSSRNSGNLQPFLRHPDGRYDLNRWNEAYWDRLRRFLEMTEERGIIVQMELWDRFDFAREPWDRSPFNPRNNVNYTPEASGLPVVVSTHPTDRENPFLRTTPHEEANQVVLPYQEAFVERVLEVSLPFPHVLYTINNETGESEHWSGYWADLLGAAGDSLEVPVQVTEMWAARDSRDPWYDLTHDRPDRYTYIEISQNNHWVGPTRWEGVEAHVARVEESGHLRPVNSVKIYGGPRHGGGVEEGTRKLSRNVFGGMASSRFHRPHPDGEPLAGIGLQPLAQSHIRSLRALSDSLGIYTAAPENHRFGERAPDEAYLLSNLPEVLAVYFTDGGSVTVDLSDVPGALRLRWLDIGETSWMDGPLVQGGDEVVLSPPGSGPRAALLRTP